MNFYINTRVLMITYLLKILYMYIEIIYNTVNK